MRLLLIVNSSASSVTARGPGRDPEGAVRRPRGHDGRDQPPGPRHPPRTGGGQRRRRRGRRASAATARSTRRQRPGRHRHRARAAARRFDERVRPHDRPAQRPDRSDGRAARRARSQERIERVGLGSVNGRYFLFHVGIGFDAAVVEQVERRAALKRYVSATRSSSTRRSPRGSATTTAAGPASPCVEDQGGVIDDGYFAICFNTNPYTYLGNRPFNVVPEATLDRGLAIGDVPVARARPAARERRPRALGFGRDIRRQQPSTSAPISTRLERRRSRPVPLPGRR